MPFIETEIWMPSAGRPGAATYGGQRKAQEIFKELETHLITEGRLPDEYFLLNRAWKDGIQFPSDAEIICKVNFGDSEGVYLDIYLKYTKELHEHSRDDGVLGWHKRKVTERFVTGKTLGEGIDDLDRMYLAASSVTAAFYASKAQIQERYAKLEKGTVHAAYPAVPEKPDASMASAKTIYGDISPGDWVVSVGNNDYKYMIGTVTEIVKAGTPEHTAETMNDTDSIHVDFTAFEYPQERIAEIEEYFSELYSELKQFDELPLEDVIMAPKMLIRITDLGDDEIRRMGKLRANCKSYCDCFPGALEPFDEKHAELMLRLEKNLLDYHDSLMGLGNRELIEMAGRISAMSDAYSYMCYYRYPNEQLELFLKYENPLEIVSDAWYDRNDTVEHMEFLMDDLYDRQGDLADYPLIVKPETPPETRTAPKPVGNTAHNAKPSIIASLHDADADAKAYNAQRAQNNSNNMKNKGKEIE